MSSTSIRSIALAFLRSEGEPINGTPLGERVTSSHSARTRSRFPRMKCPSRTGADFSKEFIVKMGLALSGGAFHFLCLRPRGDRRLHCLGRTRLSLLFFITGCDDATRNNGMGHGRLTATSA